MICSIAHQAKTILVKCFTNFCLVVNTRNLQSKPPKTKPLAPNLSPPTDLSGSLLLSGLSALQSFYESGKKVFTDVTI
jgi:hypothetical protein